MMGGGNMIVEFDVGEGKRVGSHIRMGGKAFGMSMDLDEVVTQRETPTLKIWETVGEPRLLIIGGYEMGVRITPIDKGSKTTVFINYEKNPRHSILSRLFAETYAKWCVNQMALGIEKEFLRG